MAAVEGNWLSPPAGARVVGEHRWQPCNTAAGGEDPTNCCLFLKECECSWYNVVCKMHACYDVDGEAATGEKYFAPAKEAAPGRAVPIASIAAGESSGDDKAAPLRGAEVVD
eukprot:gene10153-470_t